MRRPARHGNGPSAPIPDAAKTPAGQTAADPSSRRAARRAEKRRKSRTGRILLSILLVLCGATSAVAGYAYWTYSRLTSSIKPDTAEQSAIAEVLAPPAPTEKRFEYILLLGDDRRPRQKRARTDTIVVARVDRESGSIVMLSIPRDSRVNVAGHGMTKINAAGSWGGTPLAISTVKEFTGIPIDHYARIDFDGLALLVDQVGGVEVVVEDSFGVYTVDSHGTDVRIGTVGPGLRRLNGIQAISFCRNRQYRDGDFSRIDNQQRFLLALSKKLSQESSLSRAPQMLKTLNRHFETDMSVDDLIALARLVRSGTDDIKTFTVPGTCKRISGVSYVIPDVTRMRAFVDLLLKGETPTAI